MTVGVLGVLIIAALFFVVTMAVAVGPLLLCRIFAGPGKDECHPQPRRSSLAQGVLTFCSVVIGLGIGLFMLYFTLHAVQDRSSATVVYEDSGATAYGPMPAVVMEGGPEFLPVPIEPHSAIPVEFVEESLFAPPPPPTPPYPAQPYSDVARPLFARSFLEIGSIVLMVLILVGTAAAVLGSQTIRAGLARLAPVVLAIVLLGSLFFWTFTPQDQPAQITVNAPPAVEAPMPPTAPPRRPLVTAAELHEVTSDEAPPATVADDIATSGDSAVTQATIAEDSAEKTDPPVLAYVGIAPAGVPQKTLPKWTSQSDGGGPIRVIDSGMHATVQLAEEHALEKLKTLLQTEMAQRTPEAADWQAPDEVVLNAGNILQRAVERTQMQVGENTIPMYEAYWEVDLSRLEPLYRAWRPAVVKSRLTRIAGGVALLMLLLGSIAGFLKVDEQTHGRRRKPLAAGSLTLLALVGGLALVIVA